MLGPWAHWGQSPTAGWGTRAAMCTRGGGQRRREGGPGPLLGCSSRPGEVGGSRGLLSTCSGWTAVRLSVKFCRTWSLAGWQGSFMAQPGHLPSPQPAARAPKVQAAGRAGVLGHGQPWGGRGSVLCWPLPSSARPGCRALAPGTAGAVAPALALRGPSCPGSSVPS